MDWESFVPEHRWDIELCKWNVNKNTAKKTRPTSIWTPSRKWMKTTVKQAVGRGFKSLQLIIYKRSPRFHPSPHHRYRLPAIGKHSTSPQVGCKDSRECLCVCVCACVRVCVCVFGHHVHLCFDLSHVRLSMHGVCESCPPPASPLALTEPAESNQIKSPTKKIKDDIKEVCKHPAGRTRGWCTAHACRHTKAPRHEDNSKQLHVTGRAHNVPSSLAL